MPFITQGKTNIKYLLIIALVGAVAISIIMTNLYSFRNELISQNNFTEIKKQEKRILLTKENIQLIEKDCQGSNSYLPDYCYNFNNDLPTIDVLYSNAEKGISLKIPFNKSWGNNKYEILPYYEYEDRIEFGPLLMNIDHKWARAYTLSFRPQLSADKIIASLNKNTVNNPGTFRIQKESIKEDKVGGKTVIRYSLSQGYSNSDDVTAEISLSADITEIIGKKYNYELIACSNKFGMITFFNDNGVKNLWESFCLDEPEEMIKNINFIENPEKIVKDFYDWYIANRFTVEFINCGRGKDCGLSERKELTDILKEKLNKFVNYDQILCAQDMIPVVGFGKAQISGDKAIVKLEESYGADPPQSRFIPVELILVNGEWIINDILCNEKEPREEPKG